MRPRRFVFVALLMIACGDDTLYVMHEEFVTEGSGEEKYMEGACESVVTDSNGGGGVVAGDGPYFVITDSSAGGVEVSILDPMDRLLDSHFYTIDFLRSEEVHELVVDVADAVRLRLKSWGGSDCVTPRDPD